MITWQQWQDGISLDEMETIARNIGLTDENGNVNTCTDRLAGAFERECDCLIMAKLSLNNQRL
jgi:hypothetical protein